MPDPNYENSEIAVELQRLAGDDDELDGAVLIGYVIVAEYSAPDGERWLSQRSWTHGGPPATWTVKGWLHEVLFGGFGDDD